MGDASAFSHPRPDLLLRSILLTKDAPPKKHQRPTSPTTTPAVEWRRRSGSPKRKEAS
jgi:hypothetical protein